MKNICIIYILSLIFFSSHSLAQEQLRHEKKTHQSTDGKLFVNRDLPAYFYISTSPEATSEQFLLESSGHKQYTNPMYWGFEGLNNFHSPSCVDTFSRKVVKPERNIQFEVYADGIAPTTKAKFSGSKLLVIEKKKIYGKNLTVSLIANDKVSGVESIYFSVNGSPYKKYESALAFEGINTNEYSLKYYSVDNVGNVENIVENNFHVDITPPRVRYVVQGVQVGENVLSADSYIELKATDDISGVHSLYYSFDDEEYKLYTAEIELQKMSGGYHNLRYYGIDNVGNSSKQRKTEDLDGSVIDYMNFTVDVSGPKVDIVLSGDQFKKKYTYISGRTQINLKSSDKESGTAFIFYGIDASVRKDTFKTKFALENKPGLRKINFTAMDNAANISPTQSQTVFVDVNKPITSLDYKKGVFFNRDTLFISPNTEIVLHSQDSESGAKNTFYSIDNGEFESYSKKIEIKTTGFHNLRFYSIDNVNNEEQTKTTEFVVDDIPPEIYANFSIKPIGAEEKNGQTYNVYPPYTRLYLGATDKYSGTKDIFYKINNGKKQKYSATDNTADKNLLTQEGFYNVKITAVDMLDNESEMTIEFYIKK